MPQPTASPALWPLYAGGFIGPFGSGLVMTMLPELSENLDTSIATAASALTWYMIPFAGLMLVSGTLGARWGEARTVRRAFVVSAAASILCVVATSIGPFLLGRALQGAANAFTTPLLISMIAALARPERIGRALGTYASMQGAGQAFGPLVGGLAAQWDYRLAFAASAVAALVLVVVMPTPSRRATSAAAGAGGSIGGRWRALLNRSLAQVAGTALLGNFTSTGLILLAALVASDRFGLSPAARGLVVAVFGLAGLFTGTTSGSVADRFGLVRVGCLALIVLGLATAAATEAPWLWLLVLLTAGAGIAGTAIRAVVQTLGVSSTPANPSGAMSMTLAIQFLGTALAPVLLPVYDIAPLGAGVFAGLVALAGAVLIVLRPRGGRGGIVAGRG